MPQSFNQYNQSSESNETVIKSVICDLINAVDIEYRIMSEQNIDVEELDSTAYFEARDELTYDNDIFDTSFAYKCNETLVPNAVNNYMDLTMIADEENDYSSNRSSSTSPASDWKYSTYSPSNSDYSKSYQTVGSKYNEILDSWNLNKEDKKLKPRSSLVRNFDPLYGTETPSPPERRKVRSDRYRIDKPFAIDEQNDSTGLIEDFTKCKINETPKSEVHSYLQSFQPKSESLSFVTQMSEPKPDVLASAVQQQKENDLKDKISQLENELKEKDLKILEISQRMESEKSEKQELLKLIDLMHAINEEVVIHSTKQLESKDNVINELERKCQQLTDELKAKDERIRLLADNCNDLMTKNSSLENQITSSADKKEMENELMTYRLQMKRMEMKVQSLEQRLEQKSKENEELSSMVDQLISNVRK